MTFDYFLKPFFSVKNPSSLHFHKAWFREIHAIAPASVWFDAGMTVQMSLHVTVHKEFLATHITRIAHISGMFPRTYHIIGSHIRSRKEERERERERLKVHYT